MEPKNPPAIVGEAVAGQAAKVISQINAIIKNVNDGTFDLIPLLHEARKNQYYLPLGFNTFREYSKSLALKTTKAYYLAKIGEVAEIVGIPRSQYEEIGIAKMRVISGLKLFDKEGKNVLFNDLPMTDYVKELSGKAKDMSLEEVEKVVDHLQGKEGDEAIVWLNIAVKKMVRDLVIVPALDLAKKNIGTVGQDSDGMHKDASDGAALECIAAEYLADPANGYQAPNPTEETE